LYNVYFNITDKKYLLIEKKMSIWEYQMAGILVPLGWRCSKKVTDNDALIISFLKDEEVFYGNVGILFEDEPEKATFKYYLTKTFDEKGIRYFLRHDIFANKKASFFENKISEFTKMALEKYNNLTKDDIVNFGESDTLEIKIGHKHLRDSVLSASH